MIYKDLLIKNHIGGTVSVVLRRETISDFSEYKYFDSNFKAREEYDLWIRISKKWEADYISEPLVVAYYRNNLNRISTNVDNYISAIKLLNEKYNNEVDILLSDKKKIERLFFQNFFLGSQAIKINNSKLARKYYLKAFKFRKSIKLLIIYLVSFFGAKFILKLRYYFK
jgi:hypothetical protein